MRAVDIPGTQARSRRRGLSLIQKSMVGNALASIRSSLREHLKQHTQGSWRYREIDRAGKSIARLALHLGVELTDGGEGKQLSANEMYLRLFERALHPLSGTVPCPVPCRVQDIAIRCQQQLLLAKVAIEDDAVPPVHSTARGSNVVSLDQFRHRREVLRTTRRSH